MLEAIRATVGVEPIDDDRSRSRTGSGGAPRRGLFGGQMIAQSLAACAHTVPVGAVPDSIHANLLRTGQSGQPVEFRVERIRDGRSLQHRDVRGYQDDKLIVHATVVSSVPADGLDWQLEPIPAVPVPDIAADAPDFWGRQLGWGVFEVTNPITTDTGTGTGTGPPPHPLWVRSSIELPDDPWLHASVKAFWSDFGMNWAARATHNELDEAQISSLSASHAVWFHRRADPRVAPLRRPHPVPRRQPGLRSGRALRRRRRPRRLDPAERLHPPPRPGAVAAGAMTSVRSDTGTRRRRLGRVVTVIVVAVFGLLWWAPWHTGGHADSGDPGGIRLAELDRAVDQVLSAAGTPPASRQEREPFWDSCDGMKGTFGWDDLGVTVRWSATAPPPAATAVAAVLEGQGWKRTDLVNTVRWTKTLTSGSLARAFFEPDNVGPVLLLTASPVPPPASGC